MSCSWWSKQWLKKGKIGYNSNMLQKHPVSPKYNSGAYTLWHTDLSRRKQRPFLCVRVRLQPVGLTASGSSSESLSGTADVNLSSSCDWVNSATSLHVSLSGFSFFPTEFQSGILFNLPVICYVICEAIFVWLWAFSSLSFSHYSGQMPSVMTPLNQIIPARVPFPLVVFGLPYPPIPHPTYCSFIPSAPIIALSDWKSIAKAAHRLKHWWGPCGCACRCWAWRGLSGSRRSIPAHWSGHLPPSHHRTARSCQ